MCQGGGVEQPPGEASMGQASTIGLDLAKRVFQAHGADATGRVVFRKRLVRAKVLEFFAGQAPCLVALEACGGAHHWARELGKGPPHEWGSQHSWPGENPAENLMSRKL